MSDIAKKVGIVRITNPTAKLDGQHTEASFDKLGRQLVTPFCARDLIATAICTIQNSAAVADCATTLIAGDANNFLDPYYIYAANASTNAIRVELRNGTGGATVIAFDIPANDINIIQAPLPYPQAEKGQLWQVDFGINASIPDPDDVTNTTVAVGGFFIRNG